MHGSNHIVVIFLLVAFEASQRGAKGAVLEPRGVEQLRRTDPDCNRHSQTKGWAHFCFFRNTADVTILSPRPYGTPGTTTSNDCLYFPPGFQVTKCCDPSQFVIASGGVVGQSQVVATVTSDSYAKACP
ncbi:hypothetical protein Pst134EA_002971 [Puccinia striiformis f. sp. tritici]|uniref:hypothetical protein n=1 Tax=Puccinia striiformis f. sp. tritici TaxID=168172 RepID=UPI0020082F07|nr:hypothetical protein Pst134EA_002971 [Puccinia striiformis f. sp. tritici]KAH9472349.1 hypothetical protein Pst134EA_002971 [Puccinia striiformis f. sp. tritici]